MGVEIIFPIAWFVSIVSIIWLVFRSRSVATRAYTLPTLIGSAVISLLWAALDHKDGYFWQSTLTFFAPVVLILGSQAHAIKYMLGRNAATAP